MAPCFSKVSLRPSRKARHTLSNPALKPAAGNPSNATAMNNPDFDPYEGMGLVALCFVSLLILAALAAFVACWR